MSFTVPNRPDTGVEADQAEPDKGDFQTLGYRKSGVLTGGAVTRTAANTVSVEAITGYLNGEYFSLSTDTSISISAPSSGSNAKFVLILVKKAGGVFSATAIEGTTDNGGESASNALYPNFDSTTHMLVAAAYYNIGDTDIDGTSVVDKRVFVMPQANPTAVSSAPGSTDGTIGEIRIDSSITPDDGQSIVWIKTAAAVWTNLGQYSSTAAAAGATGGQGNQGSQGTAGAAGQQGTQGAQGTTGSTGQSGAAGSTGATGSAGSAGAQGTQGPQGPQGVKGDTGDQGPAGTDGDDGGYSFNVTRGYLAPQTTVASGDVLTLYGGEGISVTNTGSTFTFASTAAASTYSFKTTAGGTNPQTTIGNGGLVSLIGGTEMVVTQSGSTFTFNYVGTTSAEYVSTTKTSPQTLLSSLFTEHLIPTATATYILGSPWYKYGSAYFSSDVYGNSFISASDRALKQSFGAAPGLAFINALGPLSFEFKDAPGKVRWGLIAQDVETVCDNLGIPSVVVQDEPETGNKHLNYPAFTAPMIKAIQELTVRLEALENG